MSSHRLSVSGERPFSQSGGGGAMSAMQYTAKAGDRAAVSLSNAGEITAVLPQTAVIERWRSPSWDYRDNKQRTTDEGEPIFNEFIVLRLPGPLVEGDVVRADQPSRPAPASIKLDVRAWDETSMLSTNVDVRRDDDNDPLVGSLGSKAELVETISLRSAPTE